MLIPFFTSELNSPLIHTIREWHQLNIQRCESAIVEHGCDNEVSPK